METVSRSDFEQRLVALCLHGAGSGWPRRQRDRHILFRSMVRELDDGAILSEGAVDGALLRWSDAVGPGIGVDHVALRRYLVDAGYLLRDAGGREYRVQRAGHSDTRFDPDVDAVDAGRLIADARAAAAARKRERAGNRRAD